MNQYGDIVTSDETFEAVIKSAREKELKNNEKVKKVKKVKTSDFEIESETKEDIIESSSVEEPASSIQSSRSNDTFRKSPVKVECYFRYCWKAMSLPVPESDLLEVWCAEIYFSNISKKKGTLYIGKVKRRFLTERDEFLDSVEPDCLNLGYNPSSTILEEQQEHKWKDIGCFKVCDIVACSLSISYHLNHKGKECYYPDLHSFLKMMDKVGCVEIQSSVSKQVTY